jgi:hypothetical protein
MRRPLVLSAACLALVACSTDYATSSGGAIDPPTNLTYQLAPSGDPATPDGITLRWDASVDPAVASYVVYSRSSSSESWFRRAQTTSASYHDNGIPDRQYAVASADANGAESDLSAPITVDASNQLSTPAALTSVSLNGAVQLSWNPNARVARPDQFNYYRLYSTSYDLDANTCDDAQWVLEGTTVSEDFIASGLSNGVSRCFAVSAVSLDGHESEWTTPRYDTPRYDARNVLLYASQVQLSSSGFRFQFPGSAQLGQVVAGNRTDIDFRVDRHSDGSLWLVTVRTGTSVVLYSTDPVEDLTSIDIAPVNGFVTGAIEASPGYGYVFQTQLADGLHFGAVRVTHVGADYLILDWAYQTDFGNPELRRTR